MTAKTPEVLAEEARFHDRAEAMRLKARKPYKVQAGLATVCFMLMGYLTLPYILDATKAKAQQGTYIPAPVEDASQAGGTGTLDAGLPRDYVDEEVVALREQLAAMQAQMAEQQRLLSEALAAANARQTIPAELQARLDRMAQDNAATTQALQQAQEALREARDSNTADARRQRATISRLESQLASQKRQMDALRNRPEPVTPVPVGDPNALELARMQMEERIRYAELDAEERKAAADLARAREDREAEFQRTIAMRQEEARLRQLEAAADAERRREEMAIEGQNDYRLREFEAGAQSAAAATAAAAAERERIRQERIAAEEAFKDRLATSSVVEDIGSTGASAASGGQGALASAGDQVAALTQGAFSTGDAFLDAASDRGVATAAATQLSDPSSLILQGTVIPATLKTAISSDLPGFITADVSRDVYSSDGVRVLLPKGTSLIGEYNSRVNTGQRRVQVAWTRAVTPDHKSIQLGSLGVDALGRSGMTGQVEARLPEKFEAAFLISIFSAIGGLGNQAVAESVVDEPVSSGTTAATQGASGVFQEYLTIPPSIYVDQGTSINVLVVRDLRFPS